MLSDLMLLFGTACAAIGVGLVFGYGEALIVVGGLVLAAGVLVGQRAEA